MRLTGEYPPLSGAICTSGVILHSREPGSGRLGGPRVERAVGRYDVSAPRLIAWPRGISALTRSSVRPFKIVPKPDGRPAVEVTNGEKKQQFVSTTRSVYQGRVFSLDV